MTTSSYTPSTAYLQMSKCIPRDVIKAKSTWHDADTA